MVCPWTSKTLRAAISVSRSEGEREGNTEEDREAEMKHRKEVKLMEKRGRRSFVVVSPSCCISYSASCMCV